MSLPLNQLILGDCAEVMAGWPENSIDTIVTDPPYGLRFMGKEWDKALPPVEAFEQMIRVLKPGGLAFVMSSPRQDLMWRMLAMLEGVGFQLRQSHLSWITKTGFPKAYDVSKGIDRKLGLEREIVGVKIRGDVEGAKSKGVTFTQAKANRNNKAIFGYGVEKITIPFSDLAKQWEGWKSITGLKPAVEMILMVNKPFSESTIVDNVLRWGTGAINVDATRIPFKGQEDKEGSKVGFDGNVLNPDNGWNTNSMVSLDYQPPEKGRFPANLLVSDGALDTGKTTKSGKFDPHHKIAKDEKGYSVKNVYGKYRYLPADQQVFYGDEGSPYRFFDLDAWAEHNGFLDVSKPDTSERDYGLRGVKKMPKSKFNKSDGKKERFDGAQSLPRRNTHPTVKPIKLMAYLIELGCPRNGVVLDPFVGSGTTCIAAKQLGRRYIGIEINEEYHTLAKARVAAYPQPLEWFTEEWSDGASSGLVLGGTEMVPEEEAQTNSKEKSGER